MKGKESALYQFMDIRMNGTINGIVSSGGECRTTTISAALQLPNRKIHITLSGFWIDKIVDGAG